MGSWSARRPGRPLESARVWYEDAVAFRQALERRLKTRARATRDLDIEWRVGEDDLLDALIEAAAYDAGDFFAYSIERAEAPEDRLGGSHRFSVAAALGGRPFEAFPLDVGLRREPDAGVEMLSAGDLLEFAGVEPVFVPAVPLERQAAGKLHAYTRTYAGSRASTRIKDLVDLAPVAELFPLDAATLREGIEATFTVRGTHTAPSTLPLPPDDWRAPFRRLSEAAGVSGDLRRGHSAAAALVDPILEATVERGTWDFEGRRWTAPRVEPS